MLSLIRALFIAVLLVPFTSSLTQADELDGCRLGVTRANVKAAACVGRELSRSINGSDTPWSRCEVRLVRRYDRLVRHTGADADTCGATAAHGAAVIADLHRSLDYVESFPTGTFEVLARDLSSPRGLSCASPEDPALVYVAEAGSGGSTESPFYIAADGRPAFIGDTGAVGRINSDLSYERVLEGLPSSAAADDGGGFLDANGPNDVAFFDNGDMVIVMGLASNANVRDGLATPGAEKLGTLLDHNGEIIADLAAYERNNNSDQRMVPEACGVQSFVEDQTSNPFRARGGQSIQLVDPGANSVLSIDSEGQISLLAANFPDQMQTMPDLGFPGGGQSACPPDGPGLPPAASTLPAQPVPTAISCPSKGSDEGCLVGELTGLPFAVNSARVYDISTGAFDYPHRSNRFHDHRRPRSR